MPTHADKMNKTGGNPPVLYIVEACVGIVLAWCWHSVGMPQLGHLLVRPGVLNRSSILDYFDIISHISYIVPTAPILHKSSFFQGGCSVPWDSPEPRQ